MDRHTSLPERRRRGGKRCVHGFAKKHVALLNALCHADKRQRNAILRTADKPLVKCICECALNVLHGSIKLRDSHKNRLKKHKNILRKLIICNKNNKKKTSWKGKKRVIVQNGGAFLPLLLAPIISALVSKLFNTATKSD